MHRCTSGEEDSRVRLSVHYVWDCSLQSEAHTGTPEACHSLIIIIIIHSDYAFELLHDLKYESTSQCEYMWVTLHAGGFFFFFITFSSLFFFYRRPALFLISILVHIFFFMAMAHSFSLSLSCFSSPSAGNITQHYATSVQFLIVTFLLSLLRCGSLSIMSVYLICLINFNMVYKV